MIHPKSWQIAKDVICMLSWNQRKNCPRPALGSVRRWKFHMDDLKRHSPKKKTPPPTKITAFFGFRSFKSSNTLEDSIIHLSKLRFKWLFRWLVSVGIHCPNQWGIAAPLEGFSQNTTSITKTYRYN